MALAPIGGEVIVVGALVLGWNFPRATAATMDFEATLIRWLAAGLSYLPWWFGTLGWVLSKVVGLHDMIILALAKLQSVPRFLLWFVPDEFARIPQQISDVTFAWARIIFGTALIYLEYRLLRVVYFLTLKPWVWMWVEDRKDHLRSPHPMYDDRPVIVRREPRF